MAAAAAAVVAVVVALSDRMGVQPDGSRELLEVAVTMLPMPIQKATSRPAPQPTTAPW